MGYCLKVPAAWIDASILDTPLFLNTLHTLKGICQLFLNIKKILHFWQQGLQGYRIVKIGGRVC